jgi:hypothetical protein
MQENSASTSSASALAGNPPASSATVDEPFMTGAELERHLKISASHRLSLDKLGMPSTLVTKKCRRYKLSEVAAFLRSRATEQEST